MKEIVCKMRSVLGRDQKGQTLMELIVVLSVSSVVVGALVFATISSLRNAQFAKYQSQATKLAQEGIDKVRAARDQGSSINGNFVINNTTITSWSDPNLWAGNTGRITGSCGDNTTTFCYFKFSGNTFSYDGVGSDIPAGTSGSEDPLGDGKFQRVVILSDDSSTYTIQKTVTVIVRWTDYSGNHQSQLTTILRKIS